MPRFCHIKKTEELVWKIPVMLGLRWTGASVSLGTRPGCEGNTNSGRKGPKVMASAGF